MEFHDTLKKRLSEISSIQALRIEQIMGQEIHLNGIKYL